MSSPPSAPADEPDPDDPDPNNSDPDDSNSAAPSPKSPDPNDWDTQVSRLVAEFMDALDDGREPDVEALAARAGDRAPELRERIQIYEAFRPKAPSTAGRFRILSPLGSGGLGDVYLAWDPKLKREVALKLLAQTARLDRRSRDWAFSEARSLAKLQHPGVVKVYEVDEAEGTGYLVMEPLRGPSLAEVLAEIERARPAAPTAGTDRPAPATPKEALARRLGKTLLPLRARVALLAEIAEALAYCHERGVLHRDIKPANILFGLDGRPRLIDFGLAHLDDADDEGLGLTQRLVGSPGYVAPEQVDQGFSGDDPRSDQFVLGIVAYEVLSGTSPFRRDTRSRTMTAISEAQPERLRSFVRDASPSLERVVMHALEREPDRRYAHLRELAFDLKAVADSRPISIDKDHVARTARLWLRRNRRAVVVVGTMIAIAVGTWVTLGFLAEREDAARIGRLIAPSAFDDSSGRGLLRRGEALRDASEDAQVFALTETFGWRHVDLIADIESAKLDWSSKLRDAVETAQAKSKRNRTTFQSNIWARLFELEGELLPELEDENGYRRRGRVRFPGGDGLSIQLFEQVGAGADEAEFFRIYKPITLTDRPTTGLFRFVAWNPEGQTTRVAYEADFVVTDPWGPELLLAPPPPDHSGTIELPAFDREVVAGVHVSVRSFRIQSQLVTREEIIKTLGHARTGPLATSGETAWANVELARDYARAVGGRLPTLLELLNAFESGEIDLPEHGMGEWVSDVMLGITSAAPLFFHYEQYRAHLRGQLPITAALISGGTTTTPQNIKTGEGVAIRVAFSR